MNFTLPEQVKMKSTAHGSGARGMAFYWYSDADELGVELEARRETRNHQFIETYRFRWLPDREFNNYQALRIATSVLTDEAIAAEKARWPQLGEVRPDLPGNKCTRHRDRPSVLRAEAKTCWIPFLGSFCGLCAECAPAASGNGQGIVDIVEERRARVRELNRQSNFLAP